MSGLRGIDKWIKRERERVIVFNADNKQNFSRHKGLSLVAVCNIKIKCSAAYHACS
jgi:hypothetical protein